MQCGDGAAAAVSGKQSFEEKIFPSLKNTKSRCVTLDDDMDMITSQVNRGGGDGGTW